MNYYNLISMMPKAVAYDADAQAFITATGISGTNASAINTLVIDLKAASIWSKMKALYPMVGGTATAHKFNLKNPLDTDAAFRLSFVGGGTHSSNGYLPNGVNAYANTFLAPTTSLTNNNTHLSFYSRTNSAGLYFDMGSGQATGQYLDLALNITGSIFADQYNNTTGRITTVNANSQGFYISSRTLSNVFKLFKNSAQIGTTNTGASTGFASLTSNLYLSALRQGTSNLYFSNRECAFASIGDGLTDLESQLLYQITEKYQVALSRNVNPTQSFYYNSAYNNETNAFLFSTQITDNTIQTATNTLVTDLKTAGVFTKMKALYPMVGGTATTHKFNLVNAQDTDAAFRLSFVGGGTHSANGYLPNGVNAYANTFLNSSIMALNSGHLSYYSRTNSVSAALRFDIGVLQNTPTSYSDLTSSYNNATIFRFNNTTPFDSIVTTNSLGFYIGSRTAVTTIKTFKNGAIVINGTAISNAVSNIPFYIGASNNNGTAQYFSDKQCAFASIGDGLTDAEALAFYNAVNAFQVSLARNV